MLQIHDRLYGTLELPDPVWEAATTCPVVLRLREVRMANIPFLSHPSFAHVDRYEHSLGVAHLAWRWARSARLPKDEGIALSLAALYHDGATPAFGHLFEEYLRRFGFDHEEVLVQVLEGSSRDLPGSERFQVFLGRQCRLRAILPRAKKSDSPLTPLAIADLAAGRGRLGKLIKGDLDLDNIDNVIRASSAMGLLNARRLLHPYELADALCLEKDQLKIQAAGGFAVSQWSEVRRILYEAILNNQYEFRAQAALKWAIEERALEDTQLRHKSAWALTDPELMFEHLRRSAFSRLLVDRLRAASPPQLLFSAWLDDLSGLVGPRCGDTISTLCADISELANAEVYVNYYPDKRLRPVRLDMTDGSGLFERAGRAGTVGPQSPRAAWSGLIGGIFTSRVERVQAGGGTGTKARLSKRAVQLDDLVRILRKHLGCQPRACALRWLGTPDERDTQLFLISGG